MKIKLMIALLLVALAACQIAPARVSNTDNVAAISSGEPTLGRILVFPGRLASGCGLRLAGTLSDSGVHGLHLRERCAHRVPRVRAELPAMNDTLVCTRCGGESYVWVNAGALPDKLAGDEKRIADILRPKAAICMLCGSRMVAGEGGIIDLDPSKFKKKE